MRQPPRVTHSLPSGPCWGSIRSRSSIVHKIPARRIRKGKGMTHKQLLDAPRGRVPLAWWGGSYIYEDPTPAPPAPPPDPRQARALRRASTEKSALGPEESPRQGRGLVLGRFMPPHLGHQYLVDFARA